MIYTHTMQLHTAFVCGLLIRPAHYLKCLPNRGEVLASRLFARWISAGRGCDCSVDAQP